MSDKWRVFYNPKGDTADVLAYPSALVEGRIAGKYMLSGEELSNSLVVQNVKRRGILAGADVKIEREAARKNDIDVAYAARGGRGSPQPYGSITLSQLMAKGSRKFKATDRDPEEPAVLLYTSGTTGKPKGVTLTHRNFIVQCRDVVTEILALTEKDTVIGVLPLFHVYGLANGLVSAVYFACAFSLIPQYSPQNLMENIANVKASILIAIPNMYMHLVQLARARRQTIPTSLRYCVSGGAPLPRSTMEDFRKTFDTEISEGYGLTETTSAVCANLSGEGYRQGSIGRPASAIEMKVFDDEDNELPAGEVGEIVINGGVLTPGYWNLPEETEELLRNGWLHTGDLGYQDEDGYFFITDRKKDLIVRGGFNISPREIEELLYTHPKVQDAAVLGVTDKREHEVVKAFVVPAEGEELTEREVYEYCSQHLSAYKVPKIVELCDSVPKSATGKVLKKELVEGYKDERLIERED